MGPSHLPSATRLTKYCGESARSFDQSGPEYSRDGPVGRIIRRIRLTRLQIGMVALGSSKYSTMPYSTTVLGAQHIVPSTLSYHTIPYQGLYSWMDHLRSVGQKTRSAVGSTTSPLSPSTLHPWHRPKKTKRWDAKMIETLFCRSSSRWPGTEK